jgi:hypothetical protein
LVDRSGLLSQQRFIKPWVSAYLHQSNPVQPSSEAKIRKNMQNTATKAAGGQLSKLRSR